MPENRNPKKNEGDQEEEVFQTVQFAYEQSGELTDVDVPRKAIRRKNRDEEDRS
ncbi:hypothetical protein [Paludifilum halophilum]|uniref:hypothetical protein n=1 Tax=Paludifilum halophilum TaxID=1642702 RepID=UPI00146A0A03|nr:hypothetical protein [Paludifilum halophilum]